MENVLLVVSLSGAFNWIYEGKATGTELSQALWFLDHDAGQEEAYIDQISTTLLKNPHRGELAKATLKTAFLLAKKRDLLLQDASKEASRRGMFPLDLLAEFLEKHGVENSEELLRIAPGGPARWFINYPAMRDTIKKAGLAVQIVLPNTSPEGWKNSL